MHTPDGFLTSWICILLLLFSVSAVIYSAIKIRKTLTKQKILLMSSFAAVIFGLQMLNFPIASGTSGHFIGAGIAAILLGPYAAVLVMAVVLLIQTFVYGDGGVFAIGVNIFNMGIIASFTAYYVYHSLKDKNKMFAGFVSCWLGVFSAAIICAIELWLSGNSGFLDVIYAMGLTHLFIGLGEAVISLGIMFYVFNVSYDRHISARYSVMFLIIGLFVVSFALPFASSNPDGLESVALNLGFFEKAETLYVLSPMPDYTFLGSEAYLFALASGIIGMLACFSLGYAIANPLVVRS